MVQQRQRISNRITDRKKSQRVFLDKSAGWNDCLEFRPIKCLVVVFFIQIFPRVFLSRDPTELGGLHLLSPLHATCDLLQSSSDRKCIFSITIIRLHRVSLWGKVCSGFVFGCNPFFIISIWTC